MIRLPNFSHCKFVLSKRALAAKIENWKMKPAKRTDNFSFIRLSWISSQTWIIIMEVTGASEEHNRNRANWLAPGCIGRSVGPTDIK